MAKQLQLRRGTTVQHSTFTGVLAEVTVDTDKDTLVVHDGATVGGFPMRKEADSYNKTEVDNKILGLIDAAPGALDTLNELAAALGDDPNFATTVTNALALKVSKDSDTGAATIPSGTTAQRKPVPVFGDQRANSTLTAMEWWNGVDWVPMGGGATGGGIDHIFNLNGQTVTTSYSIPANTNALSAGAITIADGVTVTIPDGSSWTIV